MRYTNRGDYRNISASMWREALQLIDCQSLRQIRLSNKYNIEVDLQMSGKLMDVLPEFQSCELETIIICTKIDDHRK